MPAPRTIASMTGLELDGQHAAWCSGVTGGDAIAEVVLDPPTPGAGTEPKRLGVVRYDGIAVTCASGMGAPLREAVRTFLAGDKLVYSGAIVAYDPRLAERERLEFADALITEVVFSPLDAASREAWTLRVTFAPARTIRRTGNAPAPPPPVQARKKTWLQSNFRVQIEAIDSAYVLSCTVPGVKHVSDVVSISDVVLTVPASTAELLRTWHDDAVNGTGQERSGVIELLAPDLAQALLRLELNGLGIFKLVEGAPRGGADGTATMTASMYCEQIRLAT